MLLISTYLNAQTKSESKSNHKFELGGEIHFISEKNNDEPSEYYFFSPDFSYRFHDNISVGIQFAYSKEDLSYFDYYYYEYNNATYEYVEISPYVKFNLPVNEKFGSFIQGYMGTKFLFDDETDYRDLKLGLGYGMYYQVIDKLKLEMDVTKLEMYNASDKNENNYSSVDIYWSLLNFGLRLKYCF